MKQLFEWNYTRTFESVLASFSFGAGEVAAILHFCQMKRETEPSNGIGTAFGTVFEYFVGKWETIGVCSFSQRGVFGCSVRAEKESKEKSECRYMNRFLRCRTRTYIHICREISTTSTVFKSHTNLVINVECEKPNAWQFLRFQVSPSPP